MQQRRMAEQHQVLPLRETLEQQAQPAQDADLEQMGIIDHDVQRLLRLYGAGRGLAASRKSALALRRYLLGRWPALRGVQYAKNGDRFALDAIHHDITAVRLNERANR
jgi:hypothetical protein